MKNFFSLLLALMFSCTFTVCAFAAEPYAENSNPPTLQDTLQEILDNPTYSNAYKEAAKKISAAGKLLMYHNHNIEFQKFDGKLVIDTLLESFAPDELGFTLDTYWVQMGGADVCDWIEKLADRIPCVHLKDMAVKGWEPIMAPVGEGNLPWEKILATLEKCGKTKYLLVEQDVCQESPFTCLEKSYKYLNSLGYK